jgi:ubiquinone/menaquinone biosynthesis C-methylase UbiE
MKISLTELNEITACPTCRAPLQLNEVSSITCAACDAAYRRFSYAWELIPASWRSSSDLWASWDQLQANGVVSYTQDTTRNLGVGDRPDYLQFSRFCNFEGRVLDVGCGPQAWPTHFKHHATGTQFIGVDPLVGEVAADYLQVRALAEYLPFQDSAFDHVVFATSLDHFINPLPVLQEAVRVCKPGGSIDIWIGEKSPEAPKPSVSPAWYQKLVKPEGAEDVFHFKRLESTEVKEFLRRANLEIIAEECHDVDAYRKNYFFKVRPRVLV